VDVESAMIAQAARADPEGRYLEVARSCFPFPDGIFDFAFFSYVLLEISSREAMKELLTKCVRVRLVPECVELFDYFWLDADYKRMFAEAGHVLVEEYRPSGSNGIRIRLCGRKRLTALPPYVVYVLQ
jgi:hypothetical protein